ncbi:MAG: HD domain-containing protein [Acidobacteriota bacterium]
MSRLDRTNADLLELLLELQNLDRVPRMGYLLRGVSPVESVAEHSYHVALLVGLLAPHEESVDTERALLMALLHDAAEVRSGDLPRPMTHYLPKGAKSTMESALLRDLFEPAGSSTRELLEEYGAKKSPEARFVAACDRLQLVLKARHYELTQQGDVAEFFRALDEPSEWQTIAALQKALSENRGEPDR